MEPFLVKQALFNYVENIKIRDELVGQLAALEAKQYGPSGSGGIVKAPEGNKPTRDEMLIDRMTRMQNITSDLEHIEHEITTVTKFLEILEGPELELITYKFIDRIDYFGLYEKFGFSRTQLYRLVEDIIFKKAPLVIITDQKP